MANFNRDNRSQRGGNSGGFKRRSFNGPSREPVEMHRAICDNCRKECEVPFRPTSGKPVFCSNCFEKNQSSQPRRSESRNGNFERPNSHDREMFDVVCDNCGKNCTIPFKPSNGRPVYCSNCFEKGNNPPQNDNRDRTSRNTEQTDYKGQIQELNTKLDQILALLTPAVAVSEMPTEVFIEEAPKAEKKRKSSSIEI